MFFLNYNFAAAAESEGLNLGITNAANDKYLHEQWYLKKIKADEIGDAFSSKRRVIVAVIDTGIEIHHPDIRNNIWKNSGEIAGNGIDDDGNGYIDDVYGWNFIEKNNNPGPNLDNESTYEGLVHGSVIAGIISAESNNHIGIAGITKGTKIMALKALNEKGEGDTKAVIEAIDYAINNGADIINFSFVGENYTKSLENAIKRAYNAGIIMVAAAGNEEFGGGAYFLDKKPLYPVCHDGDNYQNMLIGVSATDTLDQKAHFSGYGSKCVDISAPGVSIFGLSLNSEIAINDGNVYNKLYDGYWSGTSMAVPMVSAAAALVGENNPRLARDEIVDIIKKSSDNIERLNPDYQSLLGAGRLNIAEAVKLSDQKLKSFIPGVLVSPASNRSSEILVSESKGKESFKIEAYSKNFTGGASVASGDVDGDGVDEIITGAGEGGGPHVRIFKQNGKLIGQFFAYDKNFRGGVNVASGDVDGDGVDEIITGAGEGGGPHVRIFKQNGKLIGQFFAYDKNFRGGVNVASGNISGNNLDEIITGAGEGGGPHVRIFKLSGEVLGQFFAYDKNFRGGVNVAAGDIDGGIRNQRDEIVVGAGEGGGPHVRIFNGSGDLINQFFAYDKNFRGGVSVGMIDANHDGFDEIITGAGAGGGPHVRIFKKNAQMISSFYAYEIDFGGGVKVASIKL